MSPQSSEALVPAARPLRVALAGNPNCGKTSIFNALTGARQHVGNYPGVTVERRQGKFRIDARELELVDLPGTYSLTSYSPEERVARHELESGLDVVVMVADSTNLKRNLVLFAQLMQTGARLVLCLNMSDESKASGQRLDLAAMERLLEVPIVETVGHKGQGLDGLRAAILTAASGGGGAPSFGSQKLVLGDRLAQALAAIRPLLPKGDAFLSTDFVATRLLSADVGLMERIGRMPHGATALAEAARQRARIEEDAKSDIQLFVTERYFGFVDGLLREVLLQPQRANARAVSDQIDAILVHRFWGIPIFALVMYAIFWSTFTLGEAPMGWIESGFQWLGGAIGGLWPEGSDSLLRSLLIDGVIAGVGGVVVFLPNILLLFFGLAILEDTGYLARAAFLVDRGMHRFGLHGKSFIPLLTGFGCSVPGIMATRTLEDERDRLTTMTVLPLISCGARLPIWMLLIPAFFAPAWRAPMLFAIYAIGIALALLCALLLRKTLLKGEDSPFVMELPPYRVPTLRGSFRKMFERGWVYLRKAGTVILALSIVLWAATTFPRKTETQIDRDVAAQVEGTQGLSPDEIEGHRAQERLEYSITGRVGHTLEPLFKPLGFDWRLVTAMIGAFAAKEVFVSQLGIVYSMLGADEGSEGLRAALAADYSPLVGFSLMLFLLISAPCMATIAVTRRESGSLRWALFQLAGLTAVAYLLSLIVYQVGRLFL